MGYLNEGGYGVPENTYIAFLYYKKAKELGHTKAMMKVGLVLYNGIDQFVEKNEKEAINLWTTAAQKGDTESLNYMGLIYEKGCDYIEKDEKKVKDYTVI